MRRRIALTILATVWALLLAAGAASYGATRQVLLSDLDARLLGRVLALPELNPGRPPPPPNEGDGTDDEGGGERYVVRSEAGRRTLPGPPTPPAAGAGLGHELLAARFATLADGRRVRSLTVRARVPAAAGGVDPVPVVVTYSGSAEPYHRVLDRLLWTLGLGGAAAGLAAAAIAYRVSSTALRPLREVARVVGSISERRLDRRIAVPELPPELRPVGRRLNRMLGKLDQAFARRRQFLADASHELRTPVAALVTGLEVGLARPRSADDYRGRLSEALADATALRRLVERLMEQVRGETFGPDEPARETDVVALLTDAVRAVESLARRRDVSVRSRCSPGLRARVKTAQLESVIGNLLSNAVDYNRPGGTVDVSARADGHDLRLTVADTGVGIPDERQAAVFEPFVRADAARTGGDGHTGLGLFLVKTHLAAMNGRFAMRSKVSEGTEFYIRLPGVVIGEPRPPDTPAAGSVPVDAVTVNPL